MTGSASHTHAASLDCVSRTKNWALGQRSRSQFCFFRVGLSFTELTRLETPTDGQDNANPAPDLTGDSCVIGRQTDVTSTLASYMFVKYNTEI